MNIIATNSMLVAHTLKKNYNHILPSPLISSVDPGGMQKERKNSRETEGERQRERERERNGEVLKSQIPQNHLQSSYTHQLRET